MPFDSPELLSDAGYDSGDHIWFTTQGDSGDQSTSSSTYSAFQGSRINPHLQWDDFVPSDAQGRVVLFVLVDPSTDQIDVRIRNAVDTETVIEQTGITGGTQTVRIGPGDYTPTTTGGITDYFVQFRNGDNATSVTMLTATFMFGVQL